MSKKQTDTLLKWGGIAFLAYIVLTKAGGFISSKFSFGRPRIKLGNVSLTAVQATLTIPVTNNTPVGVPLEDLAGELKYGPYSLTQFFLSQPITIAGNSTTELGFRVSFEISQLGQDISNLIASGEWLQALKVEGTAYSAGLAFPFENTISIG